MDMQGTDPFLAMSRRGYVAQLLKGKATSANIKD
jgi:hypothetical protein